MSSGPVAEDAKAGKKRPPETPTQSTPTSASGKKRPYRRTKRPKDYNDKSTVTTTTPTLANRPVNVYDAVLGECEDLLKASIEAQKLGRLKMASAYQLLLHTRLVGLGKRFDRIAMIGATTGNQNGGHDDDDEEEDDGRTYDSEVDNTTTGSTMPTPLVGPADVANLEKPAAGLDPTLAEASMPATSGDEPLRTPQNLPPALAQLISVLPSDLEMDATMMEKLARTAVELHHQRTGRKKSADGLLASPMMDPMIGNMADNDDDDDDEGRTTPTSSNRKGRSDSTKVAWTPEEQQVVEKGVADKKSHYEIAKTLKNKTEAQVKAFIKNQAKSNQQNDTLAEDLSSPGSKKRGGRGKKPPTTAMNTVPNAMLDAKALLQGNVRLGGSR